MFQRRSRSLTPLLLALTGGFVFLLLLLAAFLGSSASCGTTLSNGRSVTIHSNAWMISLESDGNTCTTRTAGKEIIIAGDKVSVDGMQLTTMDSAVKDVQVKIESGQILFVADGQTIATVPR
jgi:uncharacterized Zn-binding protein involved in type VI secretion